MVVNLGYMDINLENKDLGDLIEESKKLYEKCETSADSWERVYSGVKATYKQNQLIIAQNKVLNDQYEKIIEQNENLKERLEVSIEQNEYLVRHAIGRE
tara:strand:- start:1 stop:297 length:297 start_codon:yes stop_codon:yes gene_type:complete